MRARLLVSKSWVCLVGVVFACVMTQPARGDHGRRFEIVIVDNQLFAQGYLHEIPDDGGGVVRPYYNAIHDHWANGSGSASATLPAFDLLDPAPFETYAITLEVLGASKWVGPPMMPPPGTIPALAPLGASETIGVEYNSNIVDTDALGALSLATNIISFGAYQFNLEYSIGLEPANTLYVLETRLTTTAPSIADSDSIFIVFSPDGATPAEKLHHASLYLEKYLGVPEPATSTLLAVGALGLGVCAGGADGGAAIARCKPSRLSPLLAVRNWPFDDSGPPLPCAPRAIERRREASSAAARNGLFNQATKAGEAMSNLGVFSWIRDSVRRSVLLGVSDAVEQLGTAADAGEPISPQLAAVLREAAAPAIGHAAETATLDHKKTRPKRLGRSLDQFRNPPQQGAGS